MEELLPGVYSIPWYNFDKGSYFNGHFIKDGAVLVDPPKMDNYELMEISKQNPPKNIIITNPDHVRESEYYRKYFGCKIWASELASQHIDKINIDKKFKHGDKLPGNITAVAMPDHKPGETALFIEKKNAIIFGDALLGQPQGQLSMLPPERFNDFSKAKEAIKALMNYKFDHVFVAHGFSIINDGKNAIEDFLKR